VVTLASAPSFTADLLHCSGDRPSVVSSTSPAPLVHLQTLPVGQRLCFPSGPTQTVSSPKAAAKHSIKADETKVKPKMVACLEGSFEVACTCKLLIASCVAALQLRKPPFIAACAGVTGGVDGVAQTEAWMGRRQAHHTFSALVSWTVLGHH